MSKFLGLDIGGTKIKKIFLVENGVYAPSFESFDTPKSKEAFTKLIYKIIFSATGKDKSFTGVGLGLPGVVIPDSGVLVKIPNLPFLNEWNIGEFLAPFGLPFRIENDSKCFLLAEARLGAAQNFKNILGIAIGTGIGGGLIINGKLFSGAHDSAGEFGHMVIENGKTLEELAQRKTKLSDPERGRVVGLAVANLINSFDPQAVVLGGGGVNSGSIKIEEVKAEALKHIVSPLAKATPILKSRLGDSAGATGAALLLQEL